MKSITSSDLTLDRAWQYPSFTVAERFSKKHKYCVCVFVINEGDRVGKQLAQMTQYAGTVDIIVADGGSKDDSLREEVLEKGSVRTLLTKTGPGRLSAQMRMAFAYALHEGYEGVIVVDGNGKDDITAIPLFVRALEEGYDHIQGSRYIPGGKAINTPLSRHLGVQLLHAPLISLSAGHHHTDTTNGFRAYSAKLLGDKHLQIFRDVFETYELHYYLAIASARSGYKLTEVPVTRAYPAKGKTPTKISPVKGNAKVLKILFKAALRQYDPKPAREGR
jgi:glycosyltransferase involved in cell wall biosynthesis